MSFCTVTAFDRLKVSIYSFIWGSIWGQIKKEDKNMPRRGENIRKRKDGRWEARYISCYQDGKAQYTSVYGVSYSETKKK